MLTSFAQNFEDVMLWRALKHIERGFYIDIGAQDPVVDSVSLGFYENGWRGVHVEPTPAYAQALRDARPDETVVQAAVGDVGELIPFFEIAGTGISTGDSDIAHRHEAAGFAHKRIDVPCIRLSSLLDNYQERDIHWMKIDVEGMELSVLRSWTPSSVRPWVVVLESTLPLSQELSHGKWEEIVLGLGYRFTYFDGLNRFYVSEKHRELLGSFTAPPNVFDDFVMAGTGSNTFCAKLNDCLVQVRHEADQHRQQLSKLEEQLKFAASECARATTDLESRIVSQAEAAEQRMREALAQSHQASQARLLVERDTAKNDVLEVVRRSSERDDSWAAQIASVNDEARHLRDALLTLERDAGAVRIQLMRAKADAAQLKSELAQRNEDLKNARQVERDLTTSLSAALDAARAQADEQGRERLLREQEISAQFLASQQQADLARASLAGHFEEQVSTLAASYREHLKSEAAMNSRLRHTLAAAQRELAAIEESLPWRLIKPFVKRASLPIEGSGKSPSSEQTLPAQTASQSKSESQISGLSQRPPTGGLPATTLNPVPLNTSESKEPPPAENLPMPAPSSTNDVIRPATTFENPATVAASVSELLKYEGRRFVQCAYLTLLKRPVDPEGLAFFTGSLERGVSKREVLRQLHRSDEGRSRNVQLPGLRSAIRRAGVNHISRRVLASPRVLFRSNASQAKTTLVVLLTLHNGEFIRGAYAAVLQRAPDADGYSFYLDRLQQGTPKWQILSELARSREARSKSHRLPGLERLIRVQQLAKLPIVGSMLRWGLSVEGTSAFETRLRAIEQKLLARADSTSAHTTATTSDALIATITSLAVAPANAVPADTHRRLKLDDDYGVDEVTWLAFLQQVIGTRLLEPLQQAGTRPPQATLWVCVEADSSTPLNSLQLTAVSLGHLQRASEYPVRIAVLATGGHSVSGVEAISAIRQVGFDVMGSLAELASAMAPNDHAFFLHSGDEVRPELHMALKYFGSFGRDMTVIDMYFRDAGRIYPILLHGFDTIHAATVDYFHSRFGIRGGHLQAVLAKEAVSTLWALVQAFLRHGDNPESRCVHIALPLLSVALTRADISRRKADLIQGLMATTSPTPRNLQRECAEEIKASVSAIICTKDSSHLLQQLLWRLLREPAIAEIVLVSNNSSNVFSIGLLDTLAEDKRVVILRYDKPFNFSAQCNLGARYAKGEQLLFLNDDICPVSDGWLQTMLDALEPSPGQDAIVGPMLIYPDQSVQHAGMFLGFNNVAGHALRHARLPDQSTSMMLEAPRKLSCLTGAALLMNRRVFDCLNGFDPLLATYLQDVDLSLRALNSGFPLVFEPRAILFHMESVSVRPELSGRYMSDVRHNEYAYFERRWGEVIAGGDEWMNPLLDPSDESMRTLRT